MREFDIDKIDLKQPSLERKLTGEVVGSLTPTAPVKPNAELEGGEFLMYPDGTVQKSVGQSHDKAGIKLNIPDGTQIISNYLKPTKQDLTTIKNSLGVKASPNDTYANVISKYAKKIGLTKLNDEQEEVFAELKKVLDKEPNATNNVNREYLSSKIKEIEDKKQDLLAKQQEAFNLVFTIQESNKAPQAQDETFQYGGISKSRFNALLKKHGLTEEQGLAMLKYGGELKKYQTGDTKQPEYTYLGELKDFDPKSPRGVQAVQTFINNWKDRPDYGYSPVNQPMRDRLKEFVKMWKLEGYSDKAIDDADQQTLNKIAGELQDKVIKTAPELAHDYGAIAPPTKQGLEWLDKNGVINSKDNPEFYENGKIMRGLGEKVKQDPKLSEKYKSVVDSLPDDKKRDYAESNYKDNQWYFRSVGAKTIEFDNEEDYKKYLEENKDNRVGEKSPYFKTGKEGAYVRPILIKEQVFDSKEEAEKFAKDKDTLYGDYYGSDDPNIFIRPKFKGQEEVKPPQKPDSQVEDLGKVSPERGPKMFYTPDQRTLPPTAMLPHLKIDTKLGRIDPIRMGIEQQLMNISDSRRFAADRIDELPPSQRAAAMSSILASSQQAENQATFQTNQWNAQNLAQTELFNVGQRDREALANAQNALDYEQRAYRARDVFDKNLRGFFDYNRRVALSDYDYNRKMNLASSIFPDYSPNYMGNWIEFDPDGEASLENRRNVMSVYGNMG
jgi:hypothetical protein